MADNRDSGARRALPGEGTGMSGVEELAEQLAVAVDALETIAYSTEHPYGPKPEDYAIVAQKALNTLRGAP